MRDRRTRRVPCSVCPGRALSSHANRFSEGWHTVEGHGRRVSSHAPASRAGSHHRRLVLGGSEGSPRASAAERVASWGDLAASNWQSVAWRRAQSSPSACLIAVTAAFPSFTPADLVGALGIGGVAIGFAFKDIFQNYLAGLLILVTRPFVVGDQIRFKDYEGTVEDIQTRATFIKTYDGRRVIIPNGDLNTNR